MPEIAHWSPDVLGADFSSLTLPLGEDSEGPVHATLVRYLPDAATRQPQRNPIARWWAALTSGFPPAATPAGPQAAILYVHGWSDYFFQTHVARYAHAAGARFYALDLRKYGRSLRPGQTPGFCTSLGDYDGDIEAAIAALREDLGDELSGLPLVLAGHSTGGLILSLWLDRHPGGAAALVLNSPWLEFQASSTIRRALAPLMALGARYDAKAPLPGVDLGFYSRATTTVNQGRWEVDERWRPAVSFPARAGWLSAVLAGHATVQAGLSIDVPVLVMLSRRSLIQPVWSDEMVAADTVLDVGLIARRSLGLGRRVTIAQYDGALHDIMLSAAPLVDTALRETSEWLTGALAHTPSVPGIEKESGTA